MLAAFAFWPAEHENGSAANPYMIQRPNVPMNFKELRRMTITALFSDDVLFDQIVLEGGKAMSLVHGLSAPNAGKLNVTSRVLTRPVNIGCNAMQPPSAPLWRVPR